MPRLNFLESLEQWRRKAQLTGSPLSQQKTADIAEGASREATERLTRMRALELEKNRQEAQKEQFRQRMAQERKDRKAAEKSSKRKSQASGAMAGAIIGMEYGASLGPFGALGGAVLGGLAGSCIIISACTSPDSYEVQVARVYRDHYMSSVQLGGYYALSTRYVKLINKYPAVKRWTKRFLVDRLVDYGEWLLGFKPKRQLRTSKIITEGFLSLCTTIGMRTNIEPYIEAHRS